MLKAILLAVGADSFLKPADASAWCLDRCYSTAIVASTKGKNPAANGQTKIEC